MAVNSAWTEPVIVDAKNPPKYPFNTVTQTKGGHSLEMDDTPSKERVRLQHRSGSFIEMQPNGDEVHKIYGDSYEIVAGSKNVKIKGQCNITIDGPCVVTINGDSIFNVNGDATQFVKGNLVQQVNGTAKITSKGDMDLTSKEDITMSAQNVYVNGDLAVRGAISSTLSISATNNVTAGMQSYAKLGFVTPGYITAGSPVPLNMAPGSIHTTGWVQGQLATFGTMYGLAGLLGGTGLIKGVNVTATATVFGAIVKDPVFSMAQDRAIFQAHRHYDSRNGLTTTPTLNSA
jgi:hypothetical protein